MLEMHHKQIYNVHSSNYLSEKLDFILFGNRFLIYYHFSDYQIRFLYSLIKRIQEYEKKGMS